MDQKFKPGDVVYLVSRGNVVGRTTVSRVTKMYAFTKTQSSESKYSQIDGSIVPRSQWDFYRIQHPTPRLNLEWGKARLRVAANNLAAAASSNGTDFDEVRKSYEVYAACFERMVALKKLVEEE